VQIRPAFRAPTGNFQRLDKSAMTVLPFTYELTKTGPVLAVMVRSLRMKRLSVTAFFLSIVLSGTFSARAVTPVTNIVLVHGAFADGSSWSKVIPLLQAKGYNVIAVQNPLSSLADDVAATKRAIAQANGPVILVGHSWAGMVISEAGNDPRVAALLYVSALVPQKGQAAADTTTGYPSAPGNAEVTKDATGYLTMTRKGIDEDFVPELPASERGVVYATQGPWNSTALSEKVLNPAWQSKPSWVIADANDRMIPPQYERDSAKQIHAKLTVLPAGHVPMLSMPDRVAAVIVDAATSSAKQR
jgi:pimeloyl-ACP methyl ester carboxylesterase